MTLDEARAALRGTHQQTLHDGVFNDVEVYWMRDGKEVASGYFSTNTSNVYVAGAVFYGEEADLLRKER